MNPTALPFANRLEIIDTVVAYATAVDTCDWQSFADLFTPDAVWAIPPGTSDTPARPRS